MTNETIAEIRNRLLLIDAYISRGLVPMENTSHTALPLLQQVDDDIRRKMRRRFRAIWRREAKRIMKQHPRNVSWAKRRLGFGSSHPSRSQRLARKELVRRYMFEHHIYPMIAEQRAALHEDDPQGV